MIRFLQTDNRVTKALLVVIIGAASVSMVVYLIPGLTNTGATAPDTYAIVYPHWYSRYFSDGLTISEARVQKMAQAQMQQQHYPDNPLIENLIEQRIGQQLVQQQILVAEAAHLGIHADNNDVIDYLHKGQAGQVLFPEGKFIGDDAYARLIADRFDMTVPEFEGSIRDDIAIRRLQAYVTAGVTVSDQEVRDTYRKNNIKIKFDYAIVSADDLRKTINPSDADLQAFFNKNAARYASAVPEQRTITYFAFNSDQLPEKPQPPTQQEIQQYFNDHLADYSVPEQAKSRHILIKVAAGADAKTDAAAKAKAEDILKQVQSGANFAELAKKYSDDPGSKDSGGELGFVQRGRMVPEFDNAIFTQKIGSYSIVKSQYGYHIVQVEDRQQAHSQPLSEVAPAITATLTRQKESAVEENYARALTDEAIKNGLEKTAAAHHLTVVTAPPVGAQGVISALPDSSQILSKAFQSKQGDPPQFASTGEGFAVFQVTGVTAAHAPAFADWKTHVLDDYRDEQLPALVSQKTAQLAADAKKLNDLAKAAKQDGATVKTSDLIDATGQVPDFGAVGQVAPQLFDMQVGQFSGPISAERNGVVVKIDDKQEPTPDDIAKNFDQTRDQLLQQRRGDAFNVFLSGLLDQYKKSKRIAMKAQPQTGLPGGSM
jgi:peptidyl-prolyl cis-trans isomerase D